jgi:hypothetical protein
MTLLALFCLPFLGFGLFAAWAGLEKWLAGDRTEGGMLMLFGLLFAGIAVGLLLLGRRGKRVQARIEARKQRHRDAPWLWNEAWADGRLRSSERTGTVVAWVFALTWNAISTPLVFLLPQEVLEKGNLAAGIGLLFPVVGAGLLVWAVRATLHWRRFGESLFEMARVPGVLGGEITGTLHASLALAASDGFVAKLSCIRRTTSGSGKNRSTHERILWTEEEPIAAAAAARGPHGIALPVRFAVPYDSRPSDPLPSDDTILWRLEVTATLPGVDFHTRYDVPVFETGDSDPDRSAESLARERGSAPAPAHGPSPSRIALNPLAAGGTEILFPAGRNPGAAAATTTFALLFSGITGVIGVQGAPIVFTAIFGMASALLLYATLTMWAGSTRVRVRSDGVAVQSRLFGIGRTQRIPADRIEGVALAVGMQSGQTAYWDLRLETKDAPKGIRAGGNIRDKREAEGLAALLRDTLRPRRAAETEPADITRR